MYVLLLVAACVDGAPFAGAHETDPGEPDGVDGPQEGEPSDIPLFDLDALPIFRLSFPDADWAARLEGLLPDGECAERPYLAGDLVFEDPNSGTVETWPDVGVRYRGHSALWVPNYSADNRWGFKLSFDTLSPGREFHENLETVNLMGTEGDYSLVREVLGLALLREAGLPAGRASWAHLYVNDEYLGVFPNSEEPDDGNFVENHFGLEAGSLYEVSGYCGNADLAYYGDDVAIYDGFAPKAWTTDADKSADLVPFLACASAASDEELAACLPAHVDVAAWLRTMAVEALSANYDGLAAAGHNYMLWFPPDGAPAVVWTYDLDLTWYGDADFIASSSLFDFRPMWVPAAPELTRRMRRVWARDFCDAVLDAAARHDPAVLTPRIEALRARLAPAIEGDPYLEMDKWDYAVDRLEDVASARYAAVIEEAERCTPPAGAR